MLYYVQSVGQPPMWDTLRRYFERYPSQAKIAKTMLRYGLCIRGDSVCCGEIEIADVALARAAGVDRRIVASTVQTIKKDDLLMKVFSELKATPHLKDVAHAMGWSAIEIIPTNASEPGILAGVTGLIADAGVSIRQAVVDDPMLTEEPRLFIVTDREVPAELVPSIRKVPGVKGVTMI
jgi:hypothetical protein